MPEDNKFIETLTETQEGQLEGSLNTSTTSSDFRYHQRLQGSLTNGLSNATEKRISKLPTDPMNEDMYVLKRGEVTFTFTLSKNGKVGLSPIAQEVLNFINITLTKKGLGSNFVQLSILDYLNLKNKLMTDKTYKQAKKDLREGALELMTTFFGYEDKRKGVPKVQIGILDNKFIPDQNGYLGLFIKQEFLDLLRMESKGILPDLCFLVNKKANPYTSQLIILLMSHKETNLGKPNEHIISIKTIVRELGLMNEEEAKAKRRTKELVVEVLERDLKRAEEKNTQLSWHYCRKNNTPLTRQEEKNLSTIYYTLNLWFDFPDTPEQIEKRNKRLEYKAKTAKKIENAKINREVNKALGKESEKQTKS